MFQLKDDQMTAFERAFPILVQTSVGAIAGTTIGFFFLPGIGLTACGLVGGLGIYTASNAIKSIRNAWPFKQNETLVVDTHSADIYSNQTDTSCIDQEDLTFE
jgi:hypothetical protein